MNFKIKNSIKLKLKSIFLTFVLCIVVLCGIFYFYTLQLRHHYEIESQFSRLLTQTLQARKYEKNFQLYDIRDNNFMSTGKSENLLQQQKTLLEIENIIKNLKEESIIKELDMDNDLNSLEHNKNEYQLTFNKLSHKIRERGYKDFGLEGKMRKAVHKLENETGFDKIEILTLRKHEKDFIIRKDLAYSDKLHKVVEKISSSSTDESSLKTLSDYEMYFDKIVSIEKQIGLGNNDGLKGELKGLIDNFEPKVQALNTRITDHINQTLFDLRITALAIAILAITLTIILGWRFASSISKPIEILDKVTQSVVSDSDYHGYQLNQINTEDELGKLAVNFKKMLNKLNTSLDEAHQQNQKLEKIAADESLRSWSREGLAILNDTLRENFSTLEQKTNAILSKLIKYINANQGAFYVLSRNEEGLETMNMSACYAYGKKKFRTANIMPGQGLVGACWLEKDYILLTNLPQDFLSITSGLGDARPNCVLIVPLIVENKVEGIIELVSFHVFKKHEIELVKRLAQMAATSITSEKNSEISETLIKINEKLLQDLKIKEFHLDAKIREYNEQFENIESETAGLLKDRLILEEEADIFNSLLGNLMDGFILTNQNFKVLKINHYASTSIGFNPEELIGNTLPMNGRISLIDKLNPENKFTNLSEEIKLLNSEGLETDLKLMVSKTETRSGIVYAFFVKKVERISNLQTQIIEPREIKNHRKTEKSV